MKHFKNRFSLTLDEVETSFKLIIKFRSFLLLCLENIYDQIPAEPYYDAPYELETSSVYEPEPPPPPPPSQTTPNSVVTINGVSIR